MTNSTVGLFRRQPIRFVRDRAHAWWYWRDWRIGIVFDHRSITVSLLCLGIEISADPRPW